MNSTMDISLISANENFDYICRGPIQGFKLYLHSPADAAVQLSKIYTEIHLSPKYEINIAVKPNVITTSENLRSYDAKIRQCFYSTERSLRFFKVYTENNCRLECLANYTLSKCNCTAFYMPSKFYFFFIKSSFTYYIFF